jgi:hypothetical protein
VRNLLPGAPRFRLGAEELVELGRLPASLEPREPYLAGRKARAPRALSGRTRMGDVSAAAEGFVVNRLGLALSFLEGAIDLPDFAGGDKTETARKAESLFADAPATGQAAAQALLLGSSVLKYAVTVPEEEMRWLGGTLAGLSSAMDARFGADEKARLVLAAREEIARRTPGHLKDETGPILTGTLEEPPEVPEAEGTLFPAGGIFG